MQTHMQIQTRTHGYAHTHTHTHTYIYIPTHASKQKHMHTYIYTHTQVSIGLLGVITQVTLQCEPVFNLHETRYTLPLDSCLNNITNIIHSGEHVKFWIDIFTQMCAVFVSSRTNESPRDNPSRTVNNLKVSRKCYLAPLSSH